MPVFPAITTQLNITGVTGTTASTLDVEGNTNAGQLVFIKETGTTDHAATVYLAGAGGGANSSVNIISDNTAASAVQISGIDTGTGTVKITHRGQAGGTDANAAAVSIDLQTTGTACKGIYIQSAGTTTGKLINIRRDASTDIFNIFPGGHLFIGNASATPGTPTGGGHLYVSAGALRYKGSSGTDVQIAGA
jgi:Hyaluronidase protein (HylP)